MTAGLLANHHRRVDSFDAPLFWFSDGNGSTSTQKTSTKEMNFKGEKFHAHRSVVSQYDIFSLLLSAAHKEQRRRKRKVNTVTFFLQCDGAFSSVSFLSFLIDFWFNPAHVSHFLRARSPFISIAASLFYYWFAFFLVAGPLFRQILAPISMIITRAHSLEKKESKGNEIDRRHRPCRIINCYSFISDISSTPAAVLDVIPINSSWLLEPDDNTRQPIYWFVRPAKGISSISRGSMMMK